MARALLTFTFTFTFTFTWMARAPLTFIILQRVHEAEIWWLLRWKLHLIKNPIGKSQLDTIKRIPFQTSLFVFGNVHEGIYHVLCMLYNIYNVWYTIYNERFSEWVSRKVISFFLIKIIKKHDQLLSVWRRYVVMYLGRAWQIGKSMMGKAFSQLLWKDYLPRQHFLERLLFSSTFSGKNHHPH